MAHPAACKNPDTCRLSYREHLLGVVFGVNAMPTRAVHRTPGLPDEPAVATEARERRWAKDMPAFKTLMEQGYNPPGIDGCHDLAQRATRDEDINA